MTVFIAGLVALDVVALGGAIRVATRSRRTRRPSADVDDDLADAGDGTPSAHTARSPTRRSSRRLWVRRACLAVSAVGAVALGGPFLPPVAVGAVVVARGMQRLARQRRARQLVERSTPDAVELLVLLVHAGLTPVGAIREMATIAPSATRGAFAAVVHRLERGEQFSDALIALPQHLGPPMVGLADVIASADRNGSPLAPILESLAHDARASRRRQHEADARRLPVRLSFPLVACTLPSFVLLAIAPAVIAALSSLSLSV